MTAAPPAVPTASEWRIGETVPWVVAWTGEDRFGLDASPLFQGYDEARQIEQPGQGAPLLKGMHLERQRRGLVQHLCQVCGRPTPPRDRFIFPTVAGRFVPLPSGELRYASNMPPLHLRCAERAQRLCPGVRKTGGQPVPLPKAGGTIAPQFELPAGMEPLAGMAQGRRVIFSYYLVQSAGFTREVQRLLR